MRLVRNLVLATLAVQLTACSVMSREECLTADWYTVGYEDGSYGRPSSRIGDYRQDCAEYGVRPDLENYRLGRRSGLDKYCTEANGYAEGVDGSNYIGVCPYEKEAAFLSGYRRGQIVYEAKREWDSIQRDLRNARSELRKIDKKILKKESQLIKDNLTSAQRADILRELNDIRHKKQELQYDIYKLANDERWSKQNYNSLRNRNSW